MRSQWNHAVARSVFVASILSGVLSAQQLTVSDVLNQGTIETVSYSNPSLAGQTVIIEVTDGKIFPTTQAISITLDANGSGSSDWTVPNWASATFNAPGCSPTSRPCQ